MLHLQPLQPATCNPLQPSRPPGRRWPPRESGARSMSSDPRPSRSVGLCARSISRSAKEGARCTESDYLGTWSDVTFVECEQRCASCPRCSYISWRPGDCLWSRRCPQLLSESRGLNNSHTTWRVRNASGTVMQPVQSWSPQEGSVPWELRPSRYDHHHCFRRELLALLHQTCMIRDNLSRGGRDGDGGSSRSIPSNSSLPIYVLHAPSLRARKALMRQQLERLGAIDVTWVQCVNRADVDAFSRRQRSCLHPCKAITRFRSFMTNGTLSLALKHRAAWADAILVRRLQTALVLEDDAMLGPDFWLLLRRLHVPADAEIVFLGSYSGNHVGSLGGSSGHEFVDRGRRSRFSLYRRNASAFPAVIGGLAYLVYERARTALDQPPLVPADVGLSFDVFRYAGRAEAEEMYCHEDGRPVRLQVPQITYGPGQWIVRPHILGKNSHFSEELEHRASMMPVPAEPRAVQPDRTGSARPPTPRSRTRVVLTAE